MKKHLNAATRIIVSHNSPGLEQARLKERYLEALNVLAAGVSSLRPIVLRLRELGVSRRRLVTWAVAAGYNESYVRSLLSRVFREAGMRERKSGAGRRTPPDALALLRYARDHFAERATKLLLAAYRAAKAEAGSQPQQQAA